MASNRASEIYRGELRGYYMNFWIKCTDDIVFIIFYF